jgi:hypothetical protein
MMRFRCYSDLCQLQGFEDRFNYLALRGSVAHETFGHDRHINQTFYRSQEWLQVRAYVIDRDRGCDLGVPGHDIHAELLVHHMEPMTAQDLIHGESWVVDPEYLITTTILTHNAIHYGDAASLPREYVPRRPGDTKLW